MLKQDSLLSCSTVLIIQSKRTLKRQKNLLRLQRKGMSLEAEVGSIGGEEDGVIGRGECADPKECKDDCRSRC